MGSFDKSYYDILSKYQDILKEGMTAKPIVYKRNGQNSFVPANDLDLAMIPPEMLFTKSDNPSQPFIPYKQTDTNTSQPQKPSISVTPDMGPQTSTMTSGDTNEPVRVQRPTIPAYQQAQLNAKANDVVGSIINQPTNTSTSGSLPTNTSKPKNVPVSNTNISPTNAPVSKSKSSQVTNAPTSRSVKR
jgi:hypothetical protein